MKNTSKNAELPQCDKTAVMARCSTCKFWTKNTFYDYEEAVNSGFCSEIGFELDIELKTGWDGGYVKSIETQSTFGCTLHNKA